MKEGLSWWTRAAGGPVGAIGLEISGGSGRRGSHSGGRGPASSLGWSRLRVGGTVSPWKVSSRDDSWPFSEIRAGDRPFLSLPPKARQARLL